MEDKWALDFKWLRVQHLVKKSLGRDTLPNMNSILFLIGIQELGRWAAEFTKEEKQDLMHIAVCKLLSYDGHFEFVGRDADGWPHYKAVTPFGKKGVKAQEEHLKERVVLYFEELEAENGGLE